MKGSNGREDTEERKEDKQGLIGGTCETSTCRKKQRESNTQRKINYEQQLLEILKERSEHIDEDKPFLLTLVPASKKPERRPEVLGKDGNAGHFEESQKYRVSATVCAMFYCKDFFTTDL